MTRRSFGSRLSVFSIVAGVFALAACSPPVAAPVASATPVAPVASATPSPSASAMHAGHPPDAHAAAPHAPTASADPDAEALDAVRRAHGGAGPWAVAGYRMGAYALVKLGLPRGSFDLEVHHESPKSVQFSCIADGAAASTGASMGKLNLTFSVVDRPLLRTTYRKKSTGETLVLRPSPAFVSRFENVPREKLGEAGRQVLHLVDADVFEEVPAAH
jgi:hypothetical protein